LIGGEAQSMWGVEIRKIGLTDTGAV